MQTKTTINNQKWGWINTFQICIMYIVLYSATFYLGVIIFENIANIPIDRDKFSSGLFLGTLVSFTPYFIIGLVLRYSLYKNQIKKAAWYTLIAGFVLEKLLPITLAITLYQDFMKHSNYGPFGLLSEEFVYFSFGLKYIILSTIISILAFYLGVTFHNLLTKMRKKGQ
jgi:hypothetical protein